MPVSCMLLYHCCWIYSCISCQWLKVHNILLLSHCFAQGCDDLHIVYPDYTTTWQRQGECSVSHVVVWLTPCYLVGNLNAMYMIYICSWLNKKYKTYALHLVNGVHGRHIWSDYWMYSMDVRNHQPFCWDIPRVYTVKPVCNDHLFIKIYYRWFIQ